MESLQVLPQNVQQKFNYIFVEMSDPRTSEWWLVFSPFTLILIMSFYHFFCAWLGPMIMRDRKAFQLKNTLMIYNACQIILSSYLVYMGLHILLFHNFNFLCSPVNYSLNDRAAVNETVATWWYLFAKVTELLDTLFFVLRKKERQISTLHLYHHNLMLFTGWFAVKYVAGGHCILLGTINSFVHVIMYTYYFISGLGPHYQKYIWWKKYLTSLQICQFIIVLVHNGIPLFTNCTFPKTVNLLIVINSVAFIYMFGSFYYTNYAKKSRKAVQKKCE